MVGFVGRDCARTLELSVMRGSRCTVPSSVENRRGAFLQRTGSQLIKELGPLHLSHAKQEASSTRTGAFESSYATVPVRSVS